MAAFRLIALNSKSNEEPNVFYIDSSTHTTLCTGAFNDAWKEVFKKEFQRGPLDTYTISECCIRVNIGAYIYLLLNH